MERNQNIIDIEEKRLQAQSGIPALIAIISGFLFSLAVIIAGALGVESGWHVIGGISITAGVLGIVAFSVLCNGFKLLGPNEAYVLTLFGKYYGTIREPGYYFLNPFCSAVMPSLTSSAVPAAQQSTAKNQVSSSPRRKISTKIMTLNNQKQKVNDVLGNPIIIGAVVIWRVSDPTRAVLHVENYMDYLSIQCDSTIRNIARLYPYDISDDDDNNEKDETTLRGSSQKIAENMRKELQERVGNAGLEILEVRITHLSYSEEIAAAMLQRQQAAAVIAARKKIVEGAVSMVHMALDQLGDEEIVVLDEERKAAMVSNLLVILCGSKDAQPVINSGTLY